VTVTALPDAAKEGTMFVPIQLSSIEGDDAGAAAAERAGGKDGFGCHFSVETKVEFLTCK